MDIGRMKERVRVQQPAATRNASGGLVNTWTTFATCWMQVQPFSATENLTSERIDSDVTHVVRCRFKDVEGITPDMRLKLLNKSSRILDISSIQNVKELDEEFELSCVELMGASA